MAVKIINSIFFILRIITLGSVKSVEYYRWYRRYIGGSWYRYYPRMFPYFSYWKREDDKWFGNEIVTAEEHYNSIGNEDLLDD